MNRISEVHPAGQRTRCSNLFQTDLSLTGRLPAARNLSGKP